MTCKLCALKANGGLSTHLGPLSAGRLIACLAGFALVAFPLAGCDGKPALTLPPVASQRDVVLQFAAALLRGDGDAARSLLVPTDDDALDYLVRQAVAPWKAQHAAIRLPARHAGARWTIGYAGRRTHDDGSFETETGKLVIIVAPSNAGARVEFFAFRNVGTRYSTHHDSQLLPSNR